MPGEKLLNRSQAEKIIAQPYLNIIEKDREEIILTLTTKDTCQLPHPNQKQD